MIELVVTLVSSAAAAAVGAVAFGRSGRQRALARAREEAERATREAEAETARLRRTLLDEARGRARQMHDQLANELEALRTELDAEEVRLAGREAALERKETETEQRNVDLDAQHQALQARREQIAASEQALAELEQQITETVHRAAGRSREETLVVVRTDLVDAVRMTAQKAARLREEQARALAEAEARRLIDLVSQRYGAPLATERLVTTVTLPKVGRARELLGAGSGLLTALTELTQVEFHAVDDETLHLGAPDPFTRELGRQAYERLGRERDLNEAMLPKLVAKARADLDRVVRQAGNKAAEVLGLAPMDADIKYLVGKLLYRTSYTQNQWAHAIETAFLCGMMAEDLGQDRQIARRAALIHDIGKVLWAETEAAGSHAVSGAAFAREHGEVGEICHAIAAHHDDEKPSTVLAHLVAAADALSGARPGARRDTEEAFSTRVDDLERICEGFGGIDKAYVIQGGRELRVIVDQSRVDDFDAARLSGEIARKIEEECTYPGQIKVTVIRESRATAVAH